MHTLAVALLLIAAAVSINAATYKVKKPTEWWQSTIMYEAWVESFKDSNGDGTGDLNGITSKLDHFVDMGVGTIWLAPFYPSPMTDSGYDVSDFKGVNPTYGTIEDFDNLVSEAHKRGLRVVVDFVPNHVSDQHPWFLAAKDGVAPYVDYFIWNTGKVLENGTRVPPNNWVDMFNEGSAWLWVEERDAYVYHQFGVHQIDLNFENPRVVEETSDILTFWMDHGVDGFRIDAVPFLFEDADLKDEPEANLGYSYPKYFSLKHLYTMNQPGGYDVVKIWKEHINNYTAAAKDDVVRAVFTEAYANIDLIMQWYESGADIAFNFFFINDGETVNPTVTDTATDIVNIIDTWMSHMPTNQTANWVFGNHDMTRVRDRFGSNRVDAINCALCLLPGVGLIYNGDELGMNGTYLTWEETTDIQACSTTPDTYSQFSRDPVRTPYQWDNTTSAGFSTNATTFLKVNPEYVTLNLAAQKEADVSHYKNVKAAIALRNTTVVKEGDLIVKVLSDNVACFARALPGHQPIVVLLNWVDTADVTVDINELITGTSGWEVLIADIYSGITVGNKYNSSKVTLPAGAAVVLRGIDD